MVDSEFKLEVNKILDDDSVALSSVVKLMMLVKVSISVKL